jgi:hypothetical protein
MKSVLLASLTVTALVGVTASEAHAQVETACFSPTPGTLDPGAAIFADVDSVATAQYCGSPAGYTSDLYLASPQFVYIATGHVTPEGNEVDLGMFVGGDELIFALYVRNTGLTYYTGPGERNPDGQVHAAVAQLANGEYMIGFEDLYGGGDRDYDDLLAIVALAPTADDDADDDGIPDAADNCPIDGNADQSDLDGDGLGDVCDACPLDWANDFDGDGVCGEADDCEGVPNPDQADADGDAFGDACDACPLDWANDADLDGVCGDVDNCPVLANPSQSDADFDFIGDACDDDSDNDGVTDANDNCVLDANPDQGDQDGDGVGNVCDGDDDNDGVIDGDDACQATGAGEIVDDSGCSIAELCPCDSIWKNHGAYVRCVAHAAGDFVAAGLMTAAEKDATVSAAGQSGCGS